MSKPNKLFILVGPSGVGKNTLLEGLLLNVPLSSPAVSLTTREPRDGEIAGVHYYYIAEKKFLEHIESNELLQYVRYAGNFYGLLRDEIDSKLSKGHVFALVEPEGVEQLKDQYPDAVSMFLFGKEQDLIDRMRKRGDSEGQIKSRMNTYDHFISYLPKADYILNNGTPGHVLEDALTIVRRVTKDE